MTLTIVIYITNKHVHAHLSQGRFASYEVHFVKFMRP